MSIKLDDAQRIRWNGKTRVTGLKIQKRSSYYRIPIPDQHVKKFKVFYSNSKYYDSLGGEVFDRNASVSDYATGYSVFEPVYDDSGSAIVKFENPIEAVLIMIQPLEWNNHISMRVGLINCEDHCTTINPPESRRVYSSVWGLDEKGIGNARSMLKSAQAWTPAWNSHAHAYGDGTKYCSDHCSLKKEDQPQWVMLNVEREYHSGATSGIHISGLKLQKRADILNRYVKKFRVFYTNDMLPCFSRLAGCDDKKEFMKNNAFIFSLVNIPVISDSGSYEFEAVYNQWNEAQVLFSEKIQARNVVIVPTEWSQFMSMRVGIIDCR